MATLKLEDADSVVANMRLYAFKKRIDEMRLLMQTAQGDLEGINTRAQKNIDNQRIVNVFFEECRQKREELLNPPKVDKKHHLYIVH